MGDKIKLLEHGETHRALSLEQPIVIRLDGKAFHTFTKGMQKPFDPGMMEAMHESTKYIMAETHAHIGYTQSDEISLILNGNEIFGGRIQKLVSVMASMATAQFNSIIHKHYPQKGLAFFDGRAFNVPDLSWAAEVLMWRQEDAIKNSISMAAGRHYSHKQLHGKNGKEKLVMLEAAGAPWVNLPVDCQQGAFFQRVTEITDILPEHRQFHPGESHYQRTKIQKAEMPRLSGVDGPARTKLLFGQAKQEPELIRQLLPGGP